MTPALLLLSFCSTGRNWTAGKLRTVNCHVAWKVSDGEMTIVPGSGEIQTKESFGDIQLHLEWAAPDPPSGQGQDRGNSGIFFMGRYELQILDSYRADTYSDGQAGAIYGQYPPLFNATKAAWAMADIRYCIQTPAI